MKFIKGHIYGYGRFSNIPVNFHEGFQLIYGLNESGKTTLFHFLLDMLFGQKVSKKKNAPFTENYYKYTPWHTNDYRGYLVYQISNGTLIHIQRTFGTEPSVCIFEGLDMREITNQFPVYPNREIGFARVHLGMNRDIFTGVATISPKTLENLGSSDNENKIKEHLIRLADTGTADQSIQVIIDRLLEYLNNIGTVRSYKRPINVLEEQLEKLKVDVTVANNIAEEIREKKYQLRLYQEQLRSLQNELQQLQNKIQYTRMYNLWRRKNDAKALREKLDEFTALAFTYANFRDFPIEQKTQLLQLEMTLGHCENQKQKIQKEIESITQEITDLELELHRTSFTPIDFITNYQEQFEELREYRLRIESGLAELYNQQDNLEEQIKETEKIISEFPETIQKRDDFYEEVDLVVNLHNNSVIETEKSERRLKESQQKLITAEEELKPLDDLFQGVTNLPELIEDYWKYKNRPEEEKRELETRLQQAEVIKGNTLSRKPVDVFLSVICLLLGLLLIYLFFKTQKTESLLLLFFVGIGFIYFLKSIFDANNMIKEISQYQIQLTEEIQKIASSEYIELHPVTTLLKKAQLQHPRELQGLYEEYSIKRNHYEELQKHFRGAEELFLVNKSRTERLFANLQARFAEVNLTLENETQIEAFRRKVHQQQETSKHLRRKLWDLREQLQRLSDNILNKEKVIRNIEEQIQKDIYNKIGNAFIQVGVLKPDEPITSETFKAYYRTESQYRELKVKISELRKKRLDLNEELRQHEEEEAQTREQIQELLTLAKVEDLDEWKKRCKMAEDARDLFSRIEQTETQLQLLLGDDTLDEIEERVKDFVPDTPAGNEWELQEIIEQKNKEIEDVKQLIQNCQDELNSLRLKSRPLNEIEEEKQTIENQLRILKKEQEAILFAISTLQQITSDYYHKIAPLLKNEISHLFNKLTNGKYTEVIVERDLTLKVLIPETKKAVPIQELSLSQGTLEQLYFSMRVAFIKIISQHEEHLPMLLDDPFSNYDHPRLCQALNTLKILGENHQILLFTCRDDILNVANDLNIPVIKMGDLTTQESRS
ncbi:MAG TPA: AAA family ATPase [Candidatus Hydrogenedens sp.]|nr:AAA family ATPase [Candidatus Hydrogenedens sp.]HPP59203.1 AAA family ATPase [Candidatus Hydrogenedens sp.]